jgi:heme-degrading monooxygenase HmoA
VKTSDSRPVTLINAFEIPVGQIDAFVEEWTERARIMSRYPGFRDAELHRALSPKGRFQLVNVSHWDSEQLYEAAHLDPEFLASRASVADHAPGAVAHPQLYLVVAGYASRSL